MATWYSKVKVYDRFDPPSIECRKIDLEGWMDNIKVARFLIGQMFDERVEMECFEENKVHNLQDFLDGDYDFADEPFLETEDQMAIISEEYESGIGKTKELASEAFRKATEEGLHTDESEWIDEGKSEWNDDKLGFKFSIIDSNGKELKNVSLMCEWGKGNIEELKEMHNVDINKEVATILANQVKLLITPEMIQHMLSELSNDKRSKKTTE